MFSTPILLITFNRPDHVRKVLGEIRKQQPVQLFVCQDGPREWCEGYDKAEWNDGRVVRADDFDKIIAVRKVVNELVDWPCELHTLYQDDNLGCGSGPMTGVDWFFKNVDMGIVMEDDCLPHPDFFGYCEELLDRYKDNDAIRFINSTLYDDRWTCETSYGFSRYMVTGAWAGWKRTWDGFDLDLKDLDSNMFRKHVLSLTGNRAEANWWYFLVKEIQCDSRKKSYWDYQMQINLFLQNAITIHPKCNLISNIGFDVEGTHTLSNDGRGDREVFPILPLKHPDTIYVDKSKDEYCWAKTHNKGFIKDTINYIYRNLLWSDGIGHKLLMKYKKLKGSGVTHRV